MVRENAGDEENKTGESRLPQKVILKVDKNRDGKTEQTHIYFDYAKARLLTKDEFIEKYIKILQIKKRHAKTRSGFADYTCASG